MQEFGHDVHAKCNGALLQRKNGKSLPFVTNAPSLSENELDKLDLEFTSYLSKIILVFIQKKQISNIDFISSHGHTIFHEPQKQITYQIGNRVELNKSTNIAVVCDFRVQDVRLGGQGAPLVPVGDLLLFKDFSHCLNLGGFSNISIKSNKTSGLTGAALAN